MTLATVHSPPSPPAAPAPAPQPLGAIDVESVRLPAERAFADALRALPEVRAMVDEVAAPDPARVRRGLMARSLLLSPGMAPEIHAAAIEARDALGVALPLEIYQSSGRENAAIHLVDNPVVLEVQGRLLTLLDRPTARAVFGHELGHYLAHGPSSPAGSVAAVALAMQNLRGVPESAVSLASRLTMAQELTADRFGLLACQDLTAFLRLEMVCTTGLPSEALTWDTEAYLAQCTALMEQCLADGTAALGSTHPEHNLRAWAGWLFTETDRYRSLTGKGSGARRIEEVDALVEKVLGRPDLDPSWHMLDAPPPELHEAALASCVLVAAADGEIAETELAALEKVFAPLVPGWRSLLVPEVARERLVELRPLLGDRAPEAQRSLFTLLLHVVAADGVVDDRELDAVASIGEALGCGELYRTLLSAVLRRLGVSRASPASAPAPLFATSRAEADEGIAVYLRGVQRRGGGGTTLRRLLRLMGHTRPEEPALARIDRALIAAGLRCDGGIAGEDLDAPLRLSVVAPPTAKGTNDPAGAGAVKLGEERTRLIEALTRLRDALVSGDGRSASVRVRRARPGRVFDVSTLDLLSVGRSERCLAQLRAGRPSRLVEAAEAGAHDDARRIASEILLLDREQRAREEETGARDLALGYPLLRATVEGYLFRAPLVLYPVRLIRDERGARGFTLAPDPDGEPVANQSLLRALFHKRGFAYPESLAAELDEMAADPERGPEAVIAALREVGISPVELSGSLTALREVGDEPATAAAADRSEVEEHALLGLFPQSSSDLLQDYDGLLADLARPEADTAELLGCAASLLPAALSPTPKSPPSETGVVGEKAAVAPVIPADPTQRMVLRRAREARALVVDGPPGTGKSQVIVNLVADALGSGLRVAVVCEKRAALDVVVQRLDALGFRHLLALVHDVHDDRKGLYGQLVARLEETTPRPFDEATAARVTAERSREEDALARRDAALCLRDGDAGLGLGGLLTLVAGLDAPTLSAPASLASLPDSGLPSLLNALASVRPYADLSLDGTPWRDPAGRVRRPSFAGFDANALRGFDEALSSVAELARRLEAEQSSAGVSAASLGPAESALRLAVGVREARDRAGDPSLFGRVLTAVTDNPVAMVPIAEAERAWQAHQSDLAALSQRVELALTPEAERALAVMLSFAGRGARFFAPAWWSARSTLQSAVALAWPERAGAAFDPAFLAELSRRSRAATAWRALDGAAASLGLQHRVPPTAAEAWALLSLLAGLSRAVGPLASVRAQLTSVGAWPRSEAPGDLAQWDSAVDARLSLLATFARYRDALSPVTRCCPWVALGAGSAALSALRDALRRDGHRVVAMDRAMDAALAKHPDVDELLRGLANSAGSLSMEQWTDRVVRQWALDRAGALARRDPEATRAALSRTDADDERSGEALTKLSRDESEHAGRRVLSKLDGAGLLRVAPAEKGRRRNTEQATREAMLKECRKQRSVMPLRAFARRFADAGLLEVLPVWLLSPETAAVLFPRAPLFDLVIFDEASQCTVESGLPVLLRARRAVIAGDERQMPPTRFFTAGDSSEDETSRPDDPAGSDLLDAESLLTLGRSRVERAGLLWHYRCRHEELIAFSNHAIYGGVLRTVPSTASPSAPAAMRWVAVEGGEYELGRNAPEARRVVDVLGEYLARESPPTLGVVTFNLSQRQCVLDEVDRRRAEDPDFARRWETASANERLDARPFVKNLENVQGDERDVIVFSLGHTAQTRKGRGGGRGASGGAEHGLEPKARSGAPLDARLEKYVPARFGPLGLRGGERRLNVAVSRAKEACVVVASFEPSMLSTASATNEGPRLFKAFLEYTWHLAGGRRAQGDRVLAMTRGADVGRAAVAVEERPPPGYVPLRVQLAMALEREGLRCEIDLGSSDFRVPVAVVDPSAPERFSVAVLCDEGDPSVGADERHAHRPSLLKARGWKVLRVSAFDWNRDRAGVIARVLSAARVRPEDSR